MDQKNKKYRHNTIAVGGTFDHLHTGHKELLRNAFESGRVVYVGLVSDEFASREGKKIDNDFETRVQELRSFLAKEFPERKYFVTKLEKNFGPGIFTREIEAIAVSEETGSRVPEANAKRREQGLPDLVVELIPLKLASDGRRISSTRIRAGEIDSEGRALERR